MEIPVYLFTGFLESGKTTFIQEALEGDDFNAGERTLFLLCEEGEAEYHPSRFFGTKVFFETIEDEEELTTEHLRDLQLKHKVERVVVEYNGMWNLDTFYQNMPEEWVTYQEMMFADARTFLQYNQNMRQLVFDKLKSAELVVFNRCERGFDKMEFHKIVRAANRRSQILYEYGKDDVEMDQIEDPLPFDFDAAIIEVEDNAFAEWYRDINEEQDKYDGKVLKVKDEVIVRHTAAQDTAAFDLEDFAGLVCRWDNAANLLKHGGWVTITAKVKVEFDDVYGEAGPVLYCSEVKEAEEADPEVAQF